MPKYDFNKAAKQLYWNRTSACVFFCRFAAYFQKTFSQEHLRVAAVSTMDLERFYEYCIKLKSKMSEERDWVCADIFTVNFEETMALKL